MNDSTKNDDLVPRPVSSEHTQQGEAQDGPVLERPNPNTETVDKVITPSAISELEEQTDAINRRLDEVERKAGPAQS